MKLGGNTILSQSFSDVGGVAYVVSGYSEFDGTPSATGQTWKVSIDSAQIASGNAFTDQPWTQFSSTFIGTGSDSISLYVQNNCSGCNLADGWSYFDNFSVAAVPEASGWAIFSVALLGLGAVTFLRRPVRGVGVPPDARGIRT